VSRFRLPGRFEWKILSALLIVAAVPLLTSAYLMSVTIGRIQVLTEQHQEAVRRSLGGAVEVYRSYFAEMKETFKERADDIAADPPDHAAELAAVPELLRARIIEGTDVDEWSVPPEVLARAHEAPATLVALPARKGGEARLLELTFGISKEVYANFLALREATEKEHDLDRLLPLVLPKIFRGLGVALISVLAFATVLGLLVARRATGRVATLRDAARRVGEGDLSVRVAPRGGDELDDLGRTFDSMVAELGDARSRLLYLQKVSAWQEVARRLAHEIKNPLTPIQLAVQELGSKYRGDDPDYKRLLATAQEILHEEVGAIRRLVDDFSAFAKLPKVEPAPVDLAQTLEDFARSHPEWQEALTVESRGPVEALCDRMLLRRVLANLVENAVQAAEAAGRKPAVRLSVALEPTKPIARIVVDDNGPGVPADARERIFDPYVTTKEHGTGLGLAIVRKIMIDHGGDVRVADEPAPAGGARFVVTLPTARAAATPAPPRATPGGRRSV
jgi:nitrogen fixation/metabolism regulation signal transduction histidine kinase